MSHPAFSQAVQNVGSGWGCNLLFSQLENLDAGVGQIGLDLRNLHSNNGACLADNRHQLVKATGCVARDKASGTQLATLLQPPPPRTMRTTGGLEHLSDEERLEELGLFRLKKR